MKKLMLLAAGVVASIAIVDCSALTTVQQQFETACTIVNGDLATVSTRTLIEINHDLLHRLRDRPDLLAEIMSELAGIETFKTDDPDLRGMWRDYSEDGMASGNPIGSFMTLWDGLNSARGQGWDANPWVWVVQFRRIHGPEKR